MISTSLPSDLWRQRAACLRYPEVFEAAADRDGRSSEVADARLVCEVCPVLSECLADALATEQRAHDHNHRWSVRGGLTPVERERAAKEATA